MSAFPLHIRPRFFYLWGVSVVLFALSEWLHVFEYVAFGWLTIVGIAGLLDAFRLQRAMQQLQVERHLPQHFSLHDENQVALEIDYQGQRGIYLSIYDEIPIEFQLRNFVLHVQAKSGEKERLTYTLKPRRRGLYTFGRVQVLAHSQWGLVQWKKAFGALEAAIKVFPSFLQMQRFEALVFQSQHAFLGIRRTRRLGHGYEFSHIRQYAQGDDPRTINGKASARAGKWMVNSFIDEKSQSVYALLLTGRIMRMPFDGLSLMDYSVNSALALLNVALKNQDQAGVISFSGKVKDTLLAGSKHQQLAMIMDKLYQVEADYDEANFEALYSYVFQHIRHRSLLLLYVHFMSVESLERVLPELKRLNYNHLLVVIFFTNTELQHFSQEDPKDLEAIASQTMASKLLEDQQLMARTLVQHGIQCVHTSPEQLSSEVLGKYLELKSRGLF